MRVEDARRCDALRRSLAVEAADPLPGARVTVEPDADRCVFILRVAADDLVHLRAATNSYLKWLKAADGAIAARAENTGEKRTE